MAELGIDIFKRGSTTYYYSSKFFPKEYLKDITKLYAFVRKADDYVDSIPQQKKEFYSFKKKFNLALKGKKVNNKVIENFIELFNRKGFEKEWVDSFLYSMELDIKKNSYKTMKELDEYLYGSSEVVGLMMAKILDLPKESFPAARYLGKGMQYINYIRDIKEDLDLGRVYFPQDEIKKCKVSSINYEEIKKNQDFFCLCVRKQILKYFAWVKKGEKGFKYIPRKFLIPIKTATDMYAWTAIKIFNNPLIVYQEKVKPSKNKILWFGLKNYIYPHSKLNSLGNKDLEKLKKCELKN
jgi:15-cis-phytoene synthase